MSPTPNYSSLERLEDLFLYVFSSRDFFFDGCMLIWGSFPHLPQTRSRHLTAGGGSRREARCGRPCSLPRRGNRQLRPEACASELRAGIRCAHGPRGSAPGPPPEQQRSLPFLGRNENPLTNTPTRPGLPHSESICVCFNMLTSCDITWPLNFTFKKHPDVPKMVIL